MVNSVLPRENDLRDRYEGVALLEESLNNGGQGLRSVQGGVMEQNNGPRLDLGGHPLDNLPGSQILPV